ncbi:MAG: outer membrane protein assembly factor BamD [Nitrospiraceae bacterium]|nr:MAG: outer membrane protein assembly factor BamD [Nitrospiraceae bacterium]
MSLRFMVSLAVIITLVACSTNKGAEKDAPFIPEEAYNRANELINSGYYDNARELLEKIPAQDTSQKFADLARLRIADTYYEQESYEEATVEYESFLNLYPYHKYGAYAQYKLAMCYFRRIQNVDTGYSWAQRAKTEFENLQRHYPRNPYMDIIENRIRECRNIMAGYELYVGNFYFKKGSFSAALGRFSIILRDYPDSDTVAEALYNSGLAYDNLGERDKAIESLNALITRYPSTELSSKARQLIVSFDQEK